VHLTMAQLLRRLTKCFFQKKRRVEKLLKRLFCSVFFSVSFKIGGFFLLLNLACAVKKLGVWGCRGGD
jgi:hypothetical protein